MNNNPRQVAFLALRDINRRGGLADVVLDQWLRESDLSDINRRLTTELVYGCVRRRRSLDSLIDYLAPKKSHQQHPDIRTILHLGFYQICYLNQVPNSAAVDTSVELVKQNGLTHFSGFVNGILRHYIRESEKCPVETSDSFNSVFTPFKLPQNPIEKLGIIYSFPDWLIQFWLDTLGLAETEQLCTWFNQSPTIDLRINPLQTTLETVESEFQSRGISVNRISGLPLGLRLTGSIGSIKDLPGYNQGWWSIQDGSAQWVSYLLDPQPGETIIDACAAPGGKTTHIAELIQDQGQVLAFDSIKSRLKKIKQNLTRLKLNSIQIKAGDARKLDGCFEIADRLLLDAPCSGLGTLHRRADGRWKHDLKNIQDLSQLQSELLETTQNWVKPGGCLVYATCTLHPQENETLIQNFLSQHSNWKIQPPPESFCLTPEPEGWIKIWPHRQNMDGFFMVKLIKDLT
ncbi:MULTISPECIES: 16S rRNA (cytosine(967)-C(5))-methyltransferase [Planktothrix]|uniref:16S rRNA (cytosine(967)-C(5))-methyltransferase n=1 Tax=Planktothrix agardhii No758 TaxID=1964479 RepID=A0A1U9WXQ1_PLAAG|nr:MULTISPECIES: 16S rRNA (cytosine(967)-C(5))-methyltransferase [Planktothrix]AQY61013.1 ribosomal RNA small subunit methyltransferase B [Planktothrix agardhii No758]CAD0217994.1 putative ribosomal RNA small subunit methyltransferase B [Planktothrix agardhii]CAD5972800.1 putative ribosomal RNA small subunit methyltransferase B [Planktothrix agardhii]CAH2573981.1 putative ribosomal RNA small subunit methyltransferase B [Planktothrix rubescens]